ncbi:MAG: hypothetical protein EOM21_03300 [Gammaproteobacteria bacterium]|nr:hypothetical protein [Gammaproteobacteria bacterium]
MAESVDAALTRSSFPSPLWLIALLISGIFVGLHTWTQLAMSLALPGSALPAVLALIQMLIGIQVASVVSQGSRASGLILGLATLILILGLFLLIFPPLNQGDLFSGGSDRDEALNVATAALLAGQYPYTASGIVMATGALVGVGGNPISPLPGELILASPFLVLTGEAAWQTFFWLPILWLTLAGTGRHPFTPDAAPATGAVVLILSNPTITVGEILTGADLLAISVALVVSSHWVLTARGRLTVIAATLLCGLAIATRPHFFMLIPLLLIALTRQDGMSGVKRGVAVALVSVGISTLVWAWNPSAFSPLHAGGWAAGFAETLPHAALWFYGTLLIALTLTSAAIALEWMRFATAAGVLLILPALLLTLFASLEAGAPIWRYAFYALTGWIFLIFAAWTTGRHG